MSNCFLCNMQRASCGVGGCLPDHGGTSVQAFSPMPSVLTLPRVDICVPHDTTRLSDRDLFKAPLSLAVAGSVVKSGSTSLECSAAPSTW